MSLRINFSAKVPNPQTPKLRPKTQNLARLIGNRAKTQTKCSSEPSIAVGESELLASLAREVAKRKSLRVQRDEAMEKSRDILFRELCLYLSMETYEVRTKWKSMEEEDKWVLVRGFVSDWAIYFHPLSLRSVKELVDDELLGH